LKINNKILPIVGILTFLLLWWFVKLFFFSESNYLSSPIETFTNLFDLLVNKNLLKDFSATFQKFAFGFLLAILIGIPLGIILGINKQIYKSVEVLLDFFRSIPVTTLFPLFILFYGISSKTIIAMVFIACVFVIILNTSYGVFYTKPSYISYLKSLKATKYQIFTNAILPSSLPFIFIGLRISVSFALIVVIVAEMFIGSNYGLGTRVYESYETYLITDVYSIILFVGIIGYLMNKLFAVLEKRIIHWK
jgi:NitT/TauT family transport system permease protein